MNSLVRHHPSRTLSQRTSALPHSQLHAWTHGPYTFQHSNVALERALALDPNLVGAASQLIVNRMDRGELLKAYDEATALVKRRPENATAHFTLSYVLRYAGMLEESARQCDTAVTLTPGSYQFRSCAWTFMELGRFDRAAILSGSTPARSGPIMLLLLCCCEKADWRKRARQ